MAKFGGGFVCLILLLCMGVPSWAASHTVGDASGWSLGVDYGTWATGKTFKVGDTLDFNYASSHTVAEVGASDYNACSASNAISSDSSGTTSIPLKTPGKHYFICGVSSHCAGGMKLAVTVTAGDGTTAPSGSTNPPASGTTPTSEAPPSTTKTPAATNGPQSSLASTLSPFAAVFFSCAAVIFKLNLS